LGEREKRVAGKEARKSCGQVPLDRKTGDKLERYQDLVQ
jgi:hypothetical protein